MIRLALFLNRENQDLANQLKYVFKVNKVTRLLLDYYNMQQEVYSAWAIRKRIQERRM